MYPSRLTDITASENMIQSSACTLPGRMPLLSSCSRPRGLGFVAAARLAASRAGAILASPDLHIDGRRGPDHGTPAQRTQTDASDGILGGFRGEAHDERHDERLARRKGPARA